MKESDERAPKDPCPLNVSKSQRSLAEEISEIAATKQENPNLHYDRARNGTVTVDAAYTAYPGPSNETTTKEIPTRDKTEQTSSGRSSCFPFGWMTFDSRETHETKDNDNSRNVTDSANHHQGQNYTVALNSQDRLFSCSGIGLLTGFLVCYHLKMNFVKPKARAIIFSTVAHRYLNL